MPARSSPNALDRLALKLSPRWGLSRIRARAAAEVVLRHYEAASAGWRTEGWHRSHADANTAAGSALAWLRAHSRDLVRNNSWAANGLGVIVDSTVGWGLTPSAVGDEAKAADKAWAEWADTSACDADGRCAFDGLQALVMRAVVESGDALIRRRWRRSSDGVPLGLQIQVLESDFLDASKDGVKGQEGGPIIQGVELDAIGRRVAYWLFDQHPGSNLLSSAVSRRVPASEIIHVYRVDRPGQVRGVPWLATAIVGLKDFDAYEDAVLKRQQVATCFVGYITDVNGSPDENTTTVGEASAADPARAEMMEPGTIRRGPPGGDVTFSSPPSVQDDGFSQRTLRRISAGLGVTYEDMTGDLSQVNFSSGRMGRLRAQARARGWRWNMFAPHACDGVWAWAMEAAVLEGRIREAPRAAWTEPPNQMIDPGSEVLAAIREVRGGLKTPSELVRQCGYDPEAFWKEYAEDQKRLDELGIKLDSDVRAVSQAGLTQERVGGGGAGSGKE